jgi:hypothetical protein
MMKRIDCSAKSQPRVNDTYRAAVLETEGSPTPMVLAN